MEIDVSKFKKKVGRKKEVRAIEPKVQEPVRRPAGPPRGRKLPKNPSGDDRVGLMAMKYEKLNLCVIPLKERSTKPLIRWRDYQRKRLSTDEIKEWWKNSPESNIGIVTGKVSGIVVVRVKGAEAKTLIKGKGGFSRTPKSKRGEYEDYYFKYPENFEVSNGKLPITIKSDGAYVIAPPSRRPSGERCAWIEGRSPFDLELAPLPGWVREYLMENHSLAAGQSKDLPKSSTCDELKFIYPVDHLTHFDQLNEALELFGSNYAIIAKACWYHLLGQASREVISFGRIRTDTRFPLAFVLPPGHGKLNIGYLIEAAGKGMGDHVAKPTSFHPEQLIGKVIRSAKNGPVTYEKVLGRFASDDLMFDDAIELVRSGTSHYQEARKYICKALDTLGRNEVEKTAVNIPETEALRYCPKCSIIIFFQPLSIPEESFLPGLFRRFPVIYKDFDEDDDDSGFDERLETGPPRDSVTNFVQYLLEVRKATNNPVTFSSDFKKPFKKYHRLLVGFGRMFGRKASNFTRTLGYTLQNLLLKMTVIQARSEGRTEVGQWDLERAFVDLLEILNSTFRFIEMKAQGYLAYGAPWRGATGKDRIILEWLASEGTTSEEESEITIKEYQEKIQKVMEVRIDAARKHYQRHKNVGWILSKQRQQTSRVWLAFKPPKDSPIVGDMGDKVSKEYYRIVEEIKRRKKEKKREEGRGGGEEVKEIVPPIPPKDEAPPQEAAGDIIT